ncbi:MAG: acyltransferase [Bacteriovoracaceae bacterium]|nr:acyltransferase [Bacteriovoracaceae bacterium]
MKIIYLILFHLVAKNLPWYSKYIGGKKFRNFLFRKITGAGEKTSLGERSNIMNITTLLKVGNNVSIADGFRLTAFKEPAILGNNVIIGFDVTLVTTQHNYEDPNQAIKNQGYRDKKIIIEDDVGVGARSFIMPGVTLGRGCYVGANAVVTKDVEPYTVVGGIPAKFIKKRKNT